MASMSMTSVDARHTMNQTCFSTASPWLLLPCGCDIRPHLDRDPAGYVAELSRGLGGNIVDDPDVDPDDGSKALSHSHPDPIHDERIELRAGDQQHSRFVNALLHDLELGDTRQIAHDINQREPVHDRAVPGDDEISRPSVDVPDQRQP